MPPCRRDATQLIGWHVTFGDRHRDLARAARDATRFSGWRVTRLAEGRLQSACPGRACPGLVRDVQVGRRASPDEEALSYERDGDLRALRPALLRRLPLRAADLRNLRPSAAGDGLEPHPAPRPGLGDPE